MIRERRNKEKLKLYYEKFINEGIIDPNVHPWVAASWQKCRELNIPNKKMPKLHQLSKQDLALRRAKHEPAIEFMDGLYEQSKQHFNIYNLSMLLVDENDFVLKNYALPFFQRILDDVQGGRVAFEDIGTTSIEIAKEHGVPFLLFGPEMWIEECHSGDACAAPIIVDGKIRYVISLFSLDQKDLPYDIVISLLLSMKYSLEKYLAIYDQLAATNTLLDELPHAIYYLKNGGKISFANKAAKMRVGNHKYLSDVFLNYEHLPIAKGFNNIASHNREVTWLTPEKTYEDITSVLPIKNANDVTNVMVVTTSIEDLKTTIAHATGYSTRYSLFSMVGNSEEFLALQAKASRLARGTGNILLQGEPGTGKQRLAYGIHQSSPRAAAPMIIVKCSNDEQALALELFGNDLDITNKVHLASEGTLFIDEIEKMPLSIGDKLAAVLKAEGDKLNVRLVAACDSNLKKLTDKGLFSKDLYELLMKTVLRIPPLRERVEDIEVIAKHILMEMSNQHHLPLKTLSRESIGMLKHCVWLGNIKQLQGVIEMAFFHTAGTMIYPENIKLPADKTLEKSWKYDKQSFIEVWKAAGGNISKLSDMLDVSRVTLYRYLKKYGLTKPE